MDVHSPDALFQALRDCGLYSPTQLATLDTVTPELKADMPTLAARLHAAGLLTGYQSRKVHINRIVELLLGPYLILDRIGEGGMGKVYKAVQRRVGRVVALKVVRPQLLMNKTVMRRYRREVAAASQLVHPNIVTVFDADEFNGRHYLAMEFVDGSDLARLVKEFGPLPYPEACEYVRQAALGLQHAHDSAFVHRDVKPSNLLVSGSRHIPGTGGEAHVKILDMGLVRSLAEEEDNTRTELTRDGTVVGTPDYMAPEQAKNSSTVGPAADLYALGGTLFYLLSGRPPFPDGTSIDKLLRHQLDPPPDLRAIRPDVPAGVVAVVNRLMAKDPADRLRTSAEVAARLAPFTGDPADEVLTAEVVSGTGGPSDSPVPDGPTEHSLNTPVRPTAVRATVRVKKPRPVGIPRPRTSSDASPSSVSASDEMYLANRRRRRKGRSFLWGWVMLGGGAAALVAAVLLLPGGGEKPDKPVASGPGPVITPPNGTGPTKPPDPPAATGMPPVGWLLPDRTAAALVVHPAGYWKMERDRNLLRPESKLTTAINGLTAKYLLNLRQVDRLTAVDAGGTVVIAEGPALAAADWPAKVKKLAGSDMQVGGHTLAAFAVPNRPAQYAGFPATPGHAPGYAIGSDNKLVSAVCKRALAGRNPAEVPNSVMAALQDEGGLLTFAAGPAWSLPGKNGQSLTAYGITLLVVKMKLGPDRFDVELVAYGQDRAALKDFLSLGLATRLAGDMPGAGKFLTDLTDLSAAEWSDSGQARVKSTARWPLVDAHEWAEELMAGFGL